MNDGTGVNGEERVEPRAAGRNRERGRKGAREGMGRKCRMRREGIGWSGMECRVAWSRTSETEPDSRNGMERRRCGAWLAEACSEVDAVWFLRQKQRCNRSVAALFAA